MSRVRWEQQQHPVQGGAKGVHHCDAFQVNNGVAVYGASATLSGYAYRYTPSSSYLSTGGVGYSLGYGVESYGANGGGVAMKKEENEMALSFSVREDKEAEAEEEESGVKRGWSSTRGDGMEMQVNMDMD